MNARPGLRALVLTTIGALAVTACGGTSDRPVAAEPASSPALTATPAGTVVPAGGDGPEGVVISSDGTLVVAVRDPGALVFSRLAADGSTTTPLGTVETPSSARHLDLATPTGPVLAPLEDSSELLAVDVGTRTITSTATHVGTTPHNAARTADGTDVVTNEHGGGVLFVRDGAVVGSLPAGPPQPGGLAVVGRYAAVADVQGNGVWVYDASARTQVTHRALGALLTHAITLAPAGALDGTGAQRGVVAFADTSGGAVELERITPQVQDTGRVAAPGRPYGLAYDAARTLLYVTLTATNRLRVVDVADPARPRVLADLPTVRQPNSVAVDPRSGTVIVTGSVDNVLELIPRSVLPGT
ncbi:MAG: hypothetical protein ABI181_03855 [Mycobacteriaceae bacterium]